MGDQRKVSIVLLTGILTEQANVRENMSFPMEQKTIVHKKPAGCSLYELLSVN